MRVQCPPVTALSRQEVWQHLPGCAAHLRLWGRSHEAAGWDNNFDPYPLVNIQKAIENGHLYWVFPLKMVIYHSYANVYQRVYWTMSLWNILVYHSTWSSYRFPFKSAIFGGFSQASPQAAVCQERIASSRLRGLLHLFGVHLQGAKEATAVFTMDVSGWNMSS